MAKRLFNKEFFIRSVKYNVRTLFRKEIEEATEQEIFQAVGYAVKDAIMDAWQRRRNMRKLIRRSYTTCPWSS